MTKDDLSFIFEDELEKGICPKCRKNKTEVDFFTGEDILCTDCRKLINKEIGYDTLKQNANVPKAYYIYSWRNYDEKFFKKIVEATNRFKNNLHLVGGSFTGKTVLMIACIDYLIKYGENSILFYNVPELLTNAQKESYSYYNYLINKCSHIRFLFLDDIFNGLNSSENKFIYEILDYRNRNNLPTVSSTNVKINDARIYSRLLRNNGVEIEINSKFWRKANER